MEKCEEECISQTHILVVINLWEKERVEFKRKRKHISSGFFVVYTTAGKWDHKGMWYEMDLDDGYWEGTIPGEGGRRQEKIWGWGKLTKLCFPSLVLFSTHSHTSGKGIKYTLHGTKLIVMDLFILCSGNDKT